jgi:hypothetical protein
MQASLAKIHYFGACAGEGFWDCAVNTTPLRDRKTFHCKADVYVYREAPKGCAFWCCGWRCLSGRSPSDACTRFLDAWSSSGMLESHSTIESCVT